MLPFLEDILWTSTRANARHIKANFLHVMTIFCVVLFMPQSNQFSTKRTRKGLFGFYDEKVIETPVECERKKVRDIILLMILQVLKVWSENNQIKLKHLIHRISIVSFDCSYYKMAIKVMFCRFIYR